MEFMFAHYRQGSITVGKLARLANGSAIAQVGRKFVLFSSNLLFILIIELSSTYTIMYVAWELGV